jgi:hypothetical protein
MNFSFEFWAGIALALPMSIAANFIYPWLTRKLEFRAIKVLGNEKVKVRKQLEKVERYKNDNLLYNTYLLSQIISMLHYTIIYAIPVFVIVMSTQLTELILGRD